MRGKNILSADLACTTKKVFVRAFHDDLEPHEWNRETGQGRMRARERERLRKRCHMS